MHRKRIQCIIANLREPQIICINGKLNSTNGQLGGSLSNAKCNSEIPQHKLKPCCWNIRRENQQSCLQTPQPPPQPQTVGRTRLISEELSNRKQDTYHKKKQQRLPKKKKQEQNKHCKNPKMLNTKHKRTNQIITL